ncbi:hypothetical protein ACS0TY_020601 [Phlomoides rotata]
MSSSKMQKLKDFFTSGGACGRSCVQKATDVIQPKPKSNPSISDHRPSSSATFSLNIDASPHCGKIEDSFAVVKDSEDPYQDFQQSMLQMILEREIYSRSDLQQLLECYLQLNSPDHHDVIVRAFMEIWNGGVVPTPGAGGDAAETPPCSSSTFVT